MAKLVRRHTSNVEIIGSNPIGSRLMIVFCALFARGVKGPSSTWLPWVFLSRVKDPRVLGKLDGDHRNSNRLKSVLSRCAGQT